MKALEKVEFNAEIVKRKGYEYFKTNISDLIKREKIGIMEEGKIIVPSDAEIRAAYNKIVGKKTAEVQTEKTKT